MKFRITKDKKSYDVDVKDEKTLHREIRKKVKDEEQSACNENEVKKEVPVEEKVNDDKKGKLELTEEDIEACKELIGLLPELKKLVEPASKEKKSEKKEKEEKDPDPEDKDAEKVEKDSEVIFENSDEDNNEIDSSEFDLDEDIVEENEESGDGVHDSALNPGTIEKKVSDANKGTVSHETEVAQYWQKRYDDLAKSK